MKAKLRINAYYSSGKKFIELPETSQFLQQKQMIPSKGDEIQLLGEDGTIIFGFQSGPNVKHILTVKKRWYNYNNCDIALILHYPPMSEF